jgi:hypothetical protein
MITYQQVLEGTTFEEDSNFNNGIRQLEWAARWLRKARIRTPVGQPDQFVVQARCVTASATVAAHLHFDGATKLPNCMYFCCPKHFSVFLSLVGWWDDLVSQTRASSVQRYLSARSKEARKLYCLPAQTVKSSVMCRLGRRKTTTLLWTVRHTLQRRSKLA